MSHPKRHPEPGTRLETLTSQMMSRDVQVGARLRREREARGWSRRDLIDAMRAHGFLPLTTDANMTRTIARWETGQVTPNRTHQQILALVYDHAILTLFGSPTVDPVWPDIDPADTLERIRRTDLTTGTIDDLHITVDRLCTAYSADDPVELLHEAGQWLTHIDLALTGRATTAQTRDLYDASAWLALLIGCLYNDLGDRARADRTRTMAGQFARDAGDNRAVAWHHEMRVWFALCDGDLREAITTADAGLAVAPAADVAVQLLGQQAEAWARLGDSARARQALDQGRQLIDQLPWCDNPRHHFTVDPAKNRKVIMRLAGLLGDYDQVVREAEAIIAEGTRPDGTHRQPMRVADALSAMAVVAGRTGDVAGAVELAGRALDVERVSLPSLRLVVGEVLAVLPPAGPGVRDLTERLRAAG